LKQWRREGKEGREERRGGREEGRKEGRRKGTRGGKGEKTVNVTFNIILVTQILRPPQPWQLCIYSTSHKVTP